MVAGLDFSRVTDAETQDGPQAEQPVRIAILGKPNTGKSTLSNVLTHTEASIVSDYAGTTRDVVEGSFRYNGRDIQILESIATGVVSLVGDAGQLVLDAGKAVVGGAVEGVTAATDAVGDAIGSVGGLLGLGGDGD